jgi:hypothetical protein
MRRSRLFLLTLLVAAFAPAAASAACPGPDGPVWIDHAAWGVHGTPVENVLARSGTVLAVQNGNWRDDYQAQGADTAGWHMQLWNLVGTPKKPKARAKVLAKVPSLAALAEHMTSCAEPILFLNEMVTVQAREPLTAKQRAYRWNVFYLAKALHARGVRVVVSLPTVPLAKTKTRNYWRQLSRFADFAHQSYFFSSREIAKRGWVGGADYLRERWRKVMRRLATFMVDPHRAALTVPFWSKSKNSGRAGLSDAAWFRVTRIKVRVAQEISEARGLETIWTWGWQTNRSFGEVDADKPMAACHYLNERDPALCDPASL